MSNIGYVIICFHYNFINLYSIMDYIDYRISKLCFIIINNLYSLVCFHYIIEILYYNIDHLHFIILNL